MTARERIQQEAEQWFLTEPVLFSIYCIHRPTLNANMQCPLRSGKGRLEYNPTLVNPMSDNILHDLLRVEMIRILLQHPYARQPLGYPSQVLKMASDMVISPAYKLSWADLSHPEAYNLPIGQHYEWYAFRLGDMRTAQKKEKDDETQEGVGGSGEKGAPTNDANDEDSGTEKPSSDYTDLWEEDALQSRQITDVIQSATQWGSIPSGMVELIKKAAEGKIDYRGVLRMFRSSVLSQKRRLTRMRPSRRFGFEQMGSHHDFTTRLLIAIDTSGSVCTENQGRYLRIITSFFKYGVQEIDVLMFDAEVQGQPLSLKDSQKNKQEFRVKGRGGTNFQVVINYLADHPDYSGLIILTDSFAPVPEVPPHLHTKLLWVIDNEAGYKKNYESLRKTGRVCLMQL